MTDPLPVTPLDQAIKDRQKGHAATPGLYRALLEGHGGKLVLLRHREEGESEDDEPETRQFDPTKPFPFVVLEDHGKQIALLFSNAARAFEAIRRQSGPMGPIDVVQMDAPLVLELLGKFQLFAGLNYGCATGPMTLPPSLLTALAQGDLLKTRPVAEVDDLSHFAAMDPSEYRTELVHALFQYLRRSKKFAAAWMFLAAKPDPATTGQDLRVVVAMDPKNDHVIHDLRLGASATLGYGNDIEFAWVHPGNATAITGLMEMATPFFLAPGASLPR